MSLSIQYDTTPNFHQEVRLLGAMLIFDDSIEERITIKRNPKLVNTNTNTNNKYNAPFRFNHLPAELQSLVIQNLGPRFFSENVSRLTISRNWYYWALQTMYRDMTLSRTSYPMAPIAGSAGAANSKYIGRMQQNLKDHLRIVRLHLDHMFRRYQILPADADLKPLKLPQLDERFKKAPIKAGHYGPKAWQGTGNYIEPYDLKSLLILSMELLYQVFSSAEVHTLEIQIREAWGLYRGLTATFESVLYDVLTRKHLSHINLDLAGLSRRNDRWHQITADDGADLNDPLPLRHLTKRRLMGLQENPEVNDFPEPGHWNERHICNSIMTVLPQLETLYYRPRCICAGIFRWDLPEQIEQWRQWWPSYEKLPGGQSHAEKLQECQEQIDSPLPKLKEVVINLALPKGHFRHRRVVHCMTFDTKLNQETEDFYADYTIKEMKRELVRFVKRLDKPRIVRLRYSRIDGGKLNRRFVDEFDAMTGETRQRPVDRWGEVTDGDH